MFLFVAAFIATVSCAVEEEEGGNDPSDRFWGWGWRCTVICNSDCQRAGYPGGRCVRRTCMCYLPLPSSTVAPTDSTTAASTTDASTVV